MIHYEYLLYAEHGSEMVAIRLDVWDTIQKMSKAKCYWFPFLWADVKIMTKERDRFEGEKCSMHFSKELLSKGIKRTSGGEKQSWQF